MREMMSDITPFALRMPRELRLRVQNEARMNRRSENSELLMLIERALPSEKGKAEAAATAPAQ